MNCEDFRNFCLLLPDVTEKMPFQKFTSAKNILAFHVNGHIFRRFEKSVPKWHETIDSSFLTDDMKSAYKAKIDDMMSRLVREKANFE